MQMRIITIVLGIVIATSKIGFAQSLSSQDSLRIVNLLASTLIPYQELKTIPNWVRRAHSKQLPLFAKTVRARSSEEKDMKLLYGKVPGELFVCGYGAESGIFVTISSSHQIWLNFYLNHGKLFVKMNSHWALSYSEILTLNCPTIEEIRKEFFSSVPRSQRIWKEGYGL